MSQSDFNEMQKKFAKLNVNTKKGVGSNKPPIPQLVFKQAKDLTKEEVYEICKAHGDVSTVRECYKSGYKFVELASAAEMEAMHEKLKITHYNLNICIDKRFKKLNTSEVPANWNNKETKNRTPRKSGKNLPRSNVQKREHSGYPGTECDDAVKVSSSESYIEITEETKNLNKNTEQYNAADQMSGTYSDAKEIQNQYFGKCAQCDRACNTICNRCSTYYCGRKCQREAWPEHRRVCGEPKSVARNVNNCKKNDHAEDLKPKYRNASLATNNYKENYPAKDEKSEAFTASQAANNYKTNDSVENSKIEERNTSQATNNYKTSGHAAAVKTVNSYKENGSVDGKGEDRSTLWGAKNYKGNGSERGKIEDRSTSWAGNNYKADGHAAAAKNKERNGSWAANNYEKKGRAAAVKTVNNYDENGSVDGKSEDSSTLCSADNYKINSPAASALNKNWNASLGAKSYKGTGSERGKSDHRSNSWAGNNYKADGRAAAAKTKERNGSWAANSYKTNGSEFYVKSDTFNTSSICFDALKERAQKADAPIQLTMPLSGSIVTITNISKANVVFIRSKSYEVEVDIIKLRSNLDELARNNNLRHLKEPLQCGQIVIVRFKERYCRALILATDDLEYIKLIYIDYGIVDRINIKDIYECPKNLAYVPRFSTPVILKNVPDCLMSKKLHSFMNSYVDNINMIINYSEDDLVKEKGAYLVELIDEKTNQNLNKLILNICEHEVSDNACKNFKHDYLPAGDNIKLVVMDNSSLGMGCISCTTLEFALKIAEFQELLQEYGEKLPGRSYAPKVGELCIAKFSADGQWYRGRCLEIDGNGCFKIIFIDYGNVTTVNKSDIRLYPAQFKYEIKTSTCKIKGLPETCEKQMVAVLERLIPANTIIKCDHVKVYVEKKRQYTVITLSSVLKKLQNDGFID